MASATVGAGTSVGPHWWVGTVDRSNPLAPKFRPAAQGIWDWGAQGPGDPMLDAAALPTSTSTKTGPAVGGSPRYVFSWVRGDGAFGTQWWAQHLSFNGVSAFPRAFSASDAGIRQSFIPALASLRQQEHSAQMCLPAGGATAVAGANGRALELLAIFGPSAACVQGTASAGPSSTFGLTVLAGCNASGACEATHVGYSADAGGNLFVDRTNSTTFAMGVPKLLVQKAPLHVSGTGTLRLHVLLDYSVLEVIGDNGTHSAAITSRSYPVGSTSDGVRLWARGSRQHVDLKAWNLRGVQCGQTLNDLCGVGARGFGQSCAVCCGTHQHALRSAGCTSSDCNDFCSRVVASKTDDRRGALWPPTNASWHGNTGRNFVLQPTAPWEASCVCEPQVTWEPQTGRWRMWYRGGWGTGRVGVATSADGRVFHKDPRSPVYVGEQPHVFKDRTGQFWLHTNQGNAGRNTSIARSHDGVNWAAVEAGVSVEQPAGMSGGGNRVFWQEPTGERKWHMLQELGMFGRTYQIFLYSSMNGLAWKLENGGKPVRGLQPVPGAPVSGPAFASIEGELRPRGPDGRYSLWFHATNGTGLTPSDIFHAYSSDLVTWSEVEMVVRHTGTDDEFDQAADPHPAVGDGKALLFFDGENNPASQCHIMAVHGSQL